MFWYTGSKNIEPCQVYNEEELAKMVTDTIFFYKETLKDVQEENKKLRANALECANEELIDEIQSLQEDLNLSYGSFASLKEKEAYTAFVEEHMHDRETSRANGGLAPYLIPHHTGIGTILKVKCQICGEEKDITDTEAW